LAKKLKLKYFSPGEIFKGCSKKKESKAALEVWEKFGKDKKFHKKIIDGVQIKKAKEGNIVADGKLSIFILRNLATYKIWINAPLKVRAARTAKRDKIQFKEALREIRKRQKIERTSWKKMYGFDYFDQRKLADMVIDSSKLTVNQTVNKILKCMR